MHLHIHTKNTNSSDHQLRSQSFIHFIHVFTPHLHKTSIPWFIDDGSISFLTQNKFPFVLRLVHGVSSAQKATEAIHRRTYGNHKHISYVLFVIKFYLLPFFICFESINRHPFISLRIIKTLKISSFFLCGVRIEKCYCFVCWYSVINRNTTYLFLPFVSLVLSFVFSTMNPINFDSKISTKFSVFVFIGLIIVLICFIFGVLLNYPFFDIRRRMKYKNTHTYTSSSEKGK